MSRKSKLILATAVFGAALFAASCGGGGGETTAGTGTGGGSGGGGTPPPPPPASVEGKVLALLNVGTNRQVSICGLLSNGTASCGNNLNPDNVVLDYVHEFGNGNVVLKDSNNKLYFFDGNQVKKLTTYRQLGSADEITTSAGINALTGTNVKWYATPNFVIMHDSSNNLVVVSKEGKVIKDTSVGSINTSCEAVTKTGTPYKLNTDGSSSTTTIPNDLEASAGGKFLVQNPNNDRIYLSDSKCSASGVEVGTVSSVDDAKMVLGGDGNFYIAVRAGTNLRYYKVSGNTSSGLATGRLPSLPNRKYSYALDGEGRLYAVNNSANDEVIVYNNNGAYINNATVYGANASGNLLGFANRVLARNGTVVYEIYQNGTNSVANGTVISIAQAPITACTDDSNTKATDGEGTNFIRCAYNSTSNGYLYSLKYSGGAYLIAYKNFSSAISEVDFVAGKALVDVSGNIHLCTTTDAPSISCNETGAPDFDRTLLKDGSTDKYLKSDGRNNVLYTSGGAVKAGDIFGPPVNVLIPAIGISGGSASFDLTKFAYIPGSGSCLTSIAYLSSPTGVPKAYTIEQPSGACVKEILKVFP